MSTRKILIFTASFGDGHDVAAQNIRDALKCVASQDVTVEIVDLYARCYDSVYQLERRTYLNLINYAPALWDAIYKFSDATHIVEYSLFTRYALRRALAEILEREQPDAVVTTYWMYNYLLGSLDKRQQRRFRWITVVPDIITIHSSWWRGGSDCFVVADEATTAALLRAGVAAGKIKPLGFPSPPSLAELSRAVRLQPPSQIKPRVVYIVNSGKKQAEEVVRQLIRCEGIELTIVVGRDANLRRKIEAAAQDSTIQVRVLGWVQDFPELLVNNHLLISKSGAGTIQAAIAARCPIIISQTARGQEEGTVQLVVENGCGAFTERPQEIAGMVNELFADGGALWQEWHANVCRLSRPDSSFKIARFIVDNMEQTLSGHETVT